MERITDSGGVGGEDGESAEADSSQALSPDALAAAYLRGRDVACPGCGYNRRDGVGAACPECGADIDLVPDKQRPSLRFMATIHVALLGVLALQCSAVIGNGMFLWNIYRNDMFYMIPAGMMTSALWGTVMGLTLGPMALLGVLQVRTMHLRDQSIGRLPLVTFWIMLGSTVGLIILNATAQLY